MKKILIASAIALATSPAFASIQAPAADQFVVSGELAAGGYSNDGKVINDGVTGIELGVSYMNGPLVGYAEIDADLDNDFGVDHTGSDAVDLDKLWFGYQTKVGTLSYGVENDTALDKIDGAGDQSIEFGLSAADASDAFNVVKWEGGYGPVVYGVSTSDTGDDAGDDFTFNTYAGIEDGILKMYVGYEQRDSDFEVLTVTGNATLGDFVLGANVWREGEDLDKDGYYVSAGYQINELYIGGGAGRKSEDDNGNIEDVANIGVSYAFTDQVEGLFDYQREIDAEKDNFFAKVAYNF
jgi:hypothetical protein